MPRHQQSRHSAHTAECAGPWKCRSGRRLNLHDTLPGQNQKPPARGGWNEKILIFVSIRALESARLSYTIGWQTRDWRSQILHNRAGVPTGPVDFRRVVLEHRHPGRDITRVISWRKAGGAGWAEHPSGHLRPALLARISLFIAPPAF